jgi:hypothetical protein
MRYGGDMEDQQAFQLEEYRALRKEIDQHMAESRIEERYAVISSGITWGWLIMNHKTNGLLWAVPVFLTAAITYRTNAMSQHIIQLGTYIRRLEEAFQAPGWEHQVIKRKVTQSNEVITGGLLILAVTAWAFRKSLAG